jgi:hypothetical protein
MVDHQVKVAGGMGFQHVKRYDNDGRQATKAVEDEIMGFVRQGWSSHERLKYKRFSVFYNRRSVSDRFFVPVTGLETGFTRITYL